MSIELRKDGDLEPRPGAALVPVDRTPTRRQQAYQAYGASSRVPQSLKTRTMDPGAPAARRLVAKKTSRSFLDILVAEGRGAWRIVRTWWRWVWLFEEREHARLESKLHASTTNLRQEAKYRWIGTGIVLVLGVIAWCLLVWLAPSWWRWALLAVLLVVFWLLGQQGVELVGKAVARGAEWLVNGEHFAEGLREAGLLKKDQVLRVISPPRTEGTGWTTTVDLPGALPASDVIANREKLAAAFKVDEESMILERERGERGNAARLTVWACEGNPFRRPVARFPLMDIDRASVWTEHPFGVDGRGRVVNLSLMWSSMLIAARPRKGKTAAARVAVAPFVLDPSVELMCFNGKPSSDWDALAPLCSRYICGGKTEDAEELLRVLQELGREVDDSYARLNSHPLEARPDHKLTELLSGDPTNGLPVRMVIIDEIHIYLQTGISTAGRGEIPLGKQIEAELIDLVKRAAAIGVIFVFITQRPSSEAISKELSSMIGTRFGLKVEGYRASNMVLGDSMSTMGYDCSKLSGIPGVGIFVPDGDESKEDIGWPTIKTYYMDGLDFQLVCKRGMALRGLDSNASAPGRDVHQMAIVDAEVIPHELDAVIAAFDGEGFMRHAELADKMGVKSTDLGKLMKKYGVEGDRDKNGRYYLISEVRDHVL